MEMICKIINREYGPYYWTANRRLILRVKDGIIQYKVVYTNTNTNTNYRSQVWSAHFFEHPGGVHIGKILNSNKPKPAWMKQFIEEYTERNGL